MINFHKGDFSPFSESDVVKQVQLYIFLYW